MGTTVTWKKLPNGDVEQTTVVNITRIKVIPAAEFAASKTSIQTAHQARLDRISRDQDHMDVMDAIMTAKADEEVFIEYDDAGTAVISKDKDPKAK